jgi:thioredoxin 1
MSAALAVDNQSFEKEVLQSPTPVLVDFWAPWCGPCKAISPTVDALAQELASQLKVVKINTDEAGEIAAKYGVMTIPTLLLIKGGEVVETLVGNQSKQAIATKIQPHLG